MVMTFHTPSFFFPLFFLLLIYITCRDYFSFHQPPPTQSKSNFLISLNYVEDLRHLPNSSLNFINQKYIWRVDELCVPYEQSKHYYTAVAMHCLVKKTFAKDCLRDEIYIYKSFLVNEANMTFKPLSSTRYTI